MEYILSFLIVLLFGFLGIVFLNFSLIKFNGKDVKIIISGDASPENLEGLVISAKSVSEKYLQGAQVFIEGGNDFEVNLLCKRYKINKL